MSQEAPAFVSVVIPCRNEKGHIESCVRTMLSQAPPEGGFEVIVADGMSDDGTRELLSQLARAHPALRVLDNTGGIVSTGLNAAIRAAQGQIIVRADVHTAYAPDYLRECVAVLKESGADNVGGPWSAVGDGYVGRGIAAVFHSPFGSGGARAHNPQYEGEVDTVYLGCWWRSLFDRIGGFDEELVRNQDDELNLRLKRAGGTVWQSTRIRSWYRPRNSLRRLFQQYIQYRILEGSRHSEASCAGVLAPSGAPGLRIYDGRAHLCIRVFIGRPGMCRVRVWYVHPLYPCRLRDDSDVDSMEAVAGSACGLCVLSCRVRLRFSTRSVGFHDQTSRPGEGDVGD